MEWLTYLLKVSVCSALFFAFYLLVLRKLTFFKFNRFYLLITLMLSFVIPVLHFNVKREVAATEIDQPNFMPDIKTVPPVQMNYIQPITLEYEPQVNHKINWLELLLYTYTIVAAIILLFSCWQLFRLLKHTGRYRKNSNGLKVISKLKGFTNCSFFNYVFINENNLSKKDLAVLLKHEQVHAKQFHSIDKILLMICKAILWFNPVVYLYDKALEQVHEYEADEKTSVDFGNQAYAALLLNLAVVKSDIALIHNFVKSPIKNRIKMLFNSKSKNIKKVMYLLVLPVGLCLAWLFSIQVVYAQVQSTKSNLKLGDKIKEGKTQNNKLLDTNKLTFIKENISVKNQKGILLDSLKGRKLITPKIISSSNIKGDINIEKTTYDLENEIGSVMKNDDIPNPTLEYRATDSIRMNKSKTIVTLYGNAKLAYGNINISGSNIVFNQNNMSAKVKNAIFVGSSKNELVKADSANFDLKTSKVELYGARSTNR